VSNDLSARIVQEAFAECSHVCCEYCDREVRLDLPPTAPARATADHRTPRCRGGRNVRANIAIACAGCNHAKGPLTEQEFLSCRHDPKTLAKARAFWARRLNDDPNPRASKTDHKVAKRERRMDRLADRVRIPDPACVFCRGTGKIRENPRLQRYCVCTIAPLDPERAAAHINGRRGESVPT
jgi:hypothetical protein